jgi:ParB/RepB/Spo0J family partition protein
MPRKQTAAKKAASPPPPPAKAPARKAAAKTNGAHAPPSADPPRPQRMAGRKRAPPIKTNIMLERLNIEYLPVSDIHPNEYNPNRMSEKDFELLLRSMREDGFTQPVIVQRDGHRIVDGEHRWRAAAALGMETLPVVLVDMTAEQMRIATLRHNRARGSEDIQLSAEVLRDLEKLGALDWAADSLMLSEAEIEKLLADIPAPDALAGDEYTAAWNPEARSDQDGRASVVASDVNNGSIVITSAMSMQALEAQREHEQKLAAARTDEERELVRKDRVFYRINLMFADSEAEIVKRVLGDRPAERLLSICQRETAEAA